MSIRFSKISRKLRRLTTDRPIWFTVSRENHRRPKRSTSKSGSWHSCERRTYKRLLCADLVRLSWTESSGRRRDETAVLENLSLSGVGLFAGVPVAEGLLLEIAVRDICLKGLVRHCSFRENGYLVSVELDNDSKWVQQPGAGFVPEHLLDVSLLELE